MTLGSTQSLTEMSTRNIPGDKDGRCVGLQTDHLYVPILFKSGSLTLLELTKPVQSCIWIAFMDLRTGSYYFLIAVYCAVRTGPLSDICD